MVCRGLFLDFYGCSLVSHLAYSREGYMMPGQRQSGRCLMSGGGMFAFGTIIHYWWAKNTHRDHYSESVPNKHLTKKAKSTQYSSEYTASSWDINSCSVCISNGHWSSDQECPVCQSVSEHSQHQTIQSLQSAEVDMLKGGFLQVLWHEATNAPVQLAPNTGLDQASQSCITFFYTLLWLQ